MTERIGEKVRPGMCKRRLMWWQPWWLGYNSEWVRLFWLYGMIPIVGLTFAVGLVLGSLLFGVQS